jgi:hypothetical protein
MWYYCAVTGESKKIVFTSGATEKIPSGGATSDFWSNDHYCLVSLMWMKIGSNDITAQVPGVS